MKITLTIFLVFFLTLSSIAQQPVNFLQFFKTLKSFDGKPIACDPSKAVEKAILEEYGAVYISKMATFSDTCRFKDEAAVTKFTGQFKVATNKFSFGDFYLQSTAKISLENVFSKLGGYINVARNCNDPGNCTSGINNDWSLRTYKQTEDNWNNNLPSDLQGKTEEWIVVNKRYYMRSYAIPGASQHNLGLAIDVNNKGAKICNDNCEKVLNDNGWFRTVITDAYHFTYLGYKETELPSKGLKKVINNNKAYWIPDM